VKRQEQVMLGLRLDDGLPLASARPSLDEAALARLVGAGLAERRRPAGDEGERLALTARGRRLGGGVTAELLA
jgi:hypothetical protein